MLWFSNGRASPPQFIGVRLTEKGGAPGLILLYPMARRKPRPSTMRTRWSRGP